MPTAKSRRDERAGAPDTVQNPGLRARFRHPKTNQRLRGDYLGQQWVLIIQYKGIIIQSGHRLEKWVERMNAGGM
jgi:hypothetical protein